MTTLEEIAYIGKFSAHEDKNKIWKPYFWCNEKGWKKPCNSNVKTRTGKLEIIKVIKLDQG